MNTTAMILNFIRLQRLQEVPWKCKPEDTLAEWALKRKCMLLPQALLKLSNLAENLDAWVIHSRSNVFISSAGKPQTLQMHKVCNSAVHQLNCVPTHLNTGDLCRVTRILTV